MTIFYSYIAADVSPKSPIFACDIKEIKKTHNAMKRHVLLSALLCCTMLSVHAQRTYTFNAVALNVDGLPESISGVTVNEGAPGAEGATTLCGILANSGWDFVGLSEDFNFHSYLTAAPASTYYNFGEHGGSVDASAIIGGADTDGLGFACAKHLTMSGGNRVEWGNYNGFTDQGSDGLVTKGFRVYTVTFATGVAVDVYILHMDADSGEKDIAARKTQLGKLATYIKDNHNNRPVIILGDTNCRYTRDELKTAFIDIINADSRFTINDTWIELIWNGVYPTYGADAMMTHTYGAQQGEIVDKIFYINTTESDLKLRANTYLHDTSIAISDHYPVVASFTLTDPHGTAATPSVETKSGDNYTKVKAAIDDVTSKAQTLDTDGQQTLDLSMVIYRYNNSLISGTGDDEVAMCYNALATAAKLQTTEGANMTYAITNPSFETGDGTGWTYTTYYDGDGNPWGDFGAYTFSTTGMDGQYVFNNWCGPSVWWGWWPHTPVAQSITAIPNGLYRLTALTASDEGRTCYVVGDGYYHEAKAIGAGAFVEHSVDFLVEDGEATIKACASNINIDHGTYYWPEGGWWYKADNFRLHYLCDETHGKVKLAIDKACTAAEKFDQYGIAAFNIDDIIAAYDNRDIESPGTATVANIYARLAAAAKAQRTANSDMTWAINNPSFETGDLTGWTVTAVADTRVAPHENTTYSVLGIDGRYLFNNWNGDAATDIATPLAQTVTGLPNGTYRLTASVTSHAGNTIYITANGAVSQGIMADDKTRFKTATVDFNVTDGTATIGAVGGDAGNSGAYLSTGGCFYKCDDFHLTLISPAELVMNETDKVVPTIEHVTYPKVTVNRTIKPNTWSTFVVPFDIPASTLEGWEVKELTGSSLNGENITLTFSDAQEGIKAGVPYMVRNTTMTESLTAITMENADVSTTLIPTETDHVIFTGVYTNGYVPEGTFFISGNKFYRAADASNTMKGFRGYIKVKDSVGTTAYSLSYRTDGATDITDTTIDDTATIVAIYNTRGMRLDDMQPGINVLQMSNGETVKIIIK